MGIQDLNLALLYSGFPFVAVHSCSLLFHYVSCIRVWIMVVVAVIGVLLMLFSTLLVLVHANASRQNGQGSNKCCVRQTFVLHTPFISCLLKALCLLHSILTKQFNSVL